MAPPPSTNMTRTGVFAPRRRLPGWLPSRHRVSVLTFFISLHLPARPLASRGAAICHFRILPGAGILVSYRRRYRPPPQREQGNAAKSRYKCRFPPAPPMPSALELLAPPRTRDSWHCRHQPRRRRGFTSAARRRPCQRRQFAGRHRPPVRLRPPLPPRVLVAVNTILQTNWKTPAARLASLGGRRRAHRPGHGPAGDGPAPIQLHASTQTDNRSAARCVSCRTSVSQVVLARELSWRNPGRSPDDRRRPRILRPWRPASASRPVLHQPRPHRAQRQPQRCSQACRLPYSPGRPGGYRAGRGPAPPVDEDNDQSANLWPSPKPASPPSRSKAASRIWPTSEHHRPLPHASRRPHRVAPRVPPLVVGRCRFTFTPAGKTFNRGSPITSSRAVRAAIGAFDSPSSSSEPIGRVVSRVDARHFEVDTTLALHNGDGISFYDAEQELVACASTAPKAAASSRPRCRPAWPWDGRLSQPRPGIQRRLWKPPTSVAVDFPVLRETAEGFALTARDEDGIGARAAIAHPPVRPTTPGGRGRPRGSIWASRQHLVLCRTLAIDLPEPRFIPAGVGQRLRREVSPTARRCPPRRPPAAAPGGRRCILPRGPADLPGQRLQRQGRAFYAATASPLIADAYTLKPAGKRRGVADDYQALPALQLQPSAPEGGKGLARTLVLMNGKEKLTLRFDCKRCEMHVVGKLKRRPLRVQPGIGPEGARGFRMAAVRHRWKSSMLRHVSRPSSPHRRPRRHRRRCRGRCRTPLRRRALRDKVRGAGPDSESSRHRSRLVGGGSHRRAGTRPKDWPPRRPARRAHRRGRPISTPCSG